MFLGAHQHTLDDKGRVILPAKFRDKLVGGVVLSFGEDRCVEVFPRAEYERRVTRLLEQVEAGEATKGRFRMFTASAFEQVPDSQGRVTIPQDLRDYARLERDLTVNGAMATIEIWNRGLWDEYEAAEADAFAGGGA